MKVSELCSGLQIDISYGRKVDRENIDISDITVDSRCAGKYSVFAPILGHRLNGGDFVKDAYGRGCRVFLSETNAEPREDCIILKTKNIRKSVAELSAKIYNYNSSEINIIGVTGTKGKTSIALTIAKILSLQNICAFSIGTLGVLDGDGNIIYKTKNTTPEPTELFRLIRDCLARGARVIALEVSSQAIMDFRVYGIEFFAIVFSCLGADHIGEGEHENFTEYVRAKRSLFTDYKTEYRILNSDDVYSPYIAFGTEKCIKCGFAESSDFLMSDFLLSSKGGLFRLNGYEIKSNMPAKYDATNTALAMVAVMLFTGKKIWQFAHHIPLVKLPGRFETYDINGRTFVIDYAHNRISFTSVLSLVRELYDGKIISVFGSVGDRSKGRRRELAEVAEHYSDFSVITSDDPGFEDVEMICREIRGWFKDKEKCEICTNREAAIFRAYELSKEGDVIMLLGKGHEDEMNICGQKIPFSEREILQKIAQLS